jgi:hypothetical protein
VGPRAGLDAEARGKMLSPLPGIEPRSPGRPTRSQTLYWVSYPARMTDTTPAKFKDISRQLTASLLDVSAATREH